MVYSRNSTIQSSRNRGCGRIGWQSDVVDRVAGNTGLRTRTLPRGSFRPFGQDLVGEGCGVGGADVVDGAGLEGDLESVGEAIGETSAASPAEDEGDVAHSLDGCDVAVVDLGAYGPGVRTPFAWGGASRRGRCPVSDRIGPESAPHFRRRAEKPDALSGP